MQGTRSTVTHNCLLIANLLTWVYRPVDAYHTAASDSSGSNVHSLTDSSGSSVHSLTDFGNDEDSLMTPVTSDDDDGEDGSEDDEFDDGASFDVVTINGRTYSVPENKQWINFYPSDEV